MTKINLPSEALQKEAFKTLPAKEKEEYISNLLKKILELNQEGVTTSQIKEATNLTYSTILHHLEILSCTAQCFKVPHGNLDVYHPYEKVKYLNDYNKANFTYAISTVENAKGKFVCIHEKRENRLGNQTVCAGVSIPFELIDKMISELTSIKKSI